MNTYNEHCIVIPARYNSSRLPGKPLLKFGEKTLIEIVSQKCAANSYGIPVFVVTDDIRIYQVCQNTGVNVLMSEGDCLTGTDRIASVLDILPFKWFINIQGDELFFKQSWLSAILGSIKSVSNDVHNLYSYTDYERAKETSIPKVVVNELNELIYMSRSLIPGLKAGHLEIYKKQIGVYAFSRKALKAFQNQNTKTPIESLEDIEILRFIELGIKVQMVEIDSHNEIAIDTKEDYELARHYFSS